MHDLKVWWRETADSIPFEKSTSTLEEAVLILDVLENFSKHRNPSAIGSPEGGLLMKKQGVNWESWIDEATGIEDPRAFLRGDHLSEADNETLTLAKEFSHILKTWLSPQEFSELVIAEINNTDLNTCHSHDYCDPNMAMSAAWENVFHRENDMQSDKDMALWNHAWGVARANTFFSGQPDERLKYFLTIWTVPGRGSIYLPAQSDVDLVKYPHKDALYAALDVEDILELFPGDIELHVEPIDAPIDGGTFKRWLVHKTDDGVSDVEHYLLDTGDITAKIAEETARLNLDDKNRVSAVYDVEPTDLYTRAILNSHYDIKATYQPEASAPTP